MKDEIKEILDKLQKVANRETASRNALMEMKDKDYQLLLDYITNLQAISDNRMKTLIKIEQYCIDEKEDLISGCEVCEDILKIIDELKGK